MSTQFDTLYLKINKHFQTSVIKNKTEYITKRNANHDGPHNVSCTKADYKTGIVKRLQGHIGLGVSNMPLIILTNNLPISDVL